MSKIFYDHLVILESVETEIKSVSQTFEEKGELWKLVDDIVHHRIMISILDHLPLSHHEEFLSKFHTSPHDQSHMYFLKEKIEDIEDIIKSEVKKLENELLSEIRLLKKKK